MTVNSISVLMRGTGIPEHFKDLHQDSAFLQNCYNYPYLAASRKNKVK